MFNQRVLLRVLIGSLAAAAAFGALVVLTASNEVADRMVGSMLTTAACSALLMGVARRSGADAGSTVSPDVTLICPICTMRLTLPQGHGRCAGCGAIFSISVRPALPKSGSSILPSRVET